MGALEFANTNESTDPLEQAIARDLWSWQAAAETDRAQIIAPCSELSLALEYYLGSAFQYDNSAPSRGWWCDGVIELSIEEIERTSFRIIGAAYWAKSGHKSSPFYLAPFEVEIYFPAPNSKSPSRSVVRFGAANHLGNIVKTPHNRNASGMVARRPRENADWAFAVELT